MYCILGTKERSLFRTLFTIKQSWNIFFECEKYSQALRLSVINLILKMSHFTLSARSMGVYSARKKEGLERFYWSTENAHAVLETKWANRQISLFYKFQHKRGLREEQLKSLWDLLFSRRRTFCVQNWGSQLGVHQREGVRGSRGYVTLR
jgi:hypothetical protein